MTPAGGRRRRPDSRGDTAGFSLVEMLVALAIVGLVGTAAMPALGHLLPARLLTAKTAALANEIARLRAQARFSREPASLRYDPVRAAFLSSRPGAAPIGTHGLTVQVSKGETSRGAPGEIRFLPDGSTTGGRILLAGSGGGRLLAVSGLTGRVTETDAAAPGPVP